jgi:hypothetical protein
MARSRKGIIVDGTKEANLELYNILKSVTTNENRKQIIDKALPIALKAYRSFVPVSKNKKESNKIKSGNLLRSVKDLRDAIPNYKWKNGVIGTVKTGRGAKNKSEVLGSEQAYDGYYAHMVYGGAKAWYRRVVAKAAKSSRAMVIATMAQEAKRVIAAEPKRFWKN